MTRAHRPSPRIRAALLVGLTVLLVGAGSTAGHALWASTATTSANVTSASVAVTETGFDTLAGELTMSTTARTTSVVVTNTGTTAGTWLSDITTAPRGTDDRAFASSTLVTAWASTQACTPNTAPGRGATTGTWANPPAISGTLQPGASATWCVRTVANPSQANAARIDATLTTVLGQGSWTGRDSGRAVQTAPDNPVTGLSCARTWGDRAVVIGWDTGTAPLSESYGINVGGTRIATVSGSTGQATISASQVPSASLGGSEVAVTVDLLRGDGSVVRPVGSGTVTGYSLFFLRSVTCA
ncbi:hypothetical protein DZF92_06870 [Clavibacter michiganensis subsp. insidiosus]|nr:hypothetical protein [Clavibacter michiganensis]AWG01034.1 hypothetical protein BEH62_05430 [Clavibacter michiganensis subsp. insidiosus]OQJ60396.1 hypothetical protein B5P21_11090 [Clavibacter michiganensis subsp. insidiosus]RII87442.1 hypothetical protein DZF92_06870 [Clavibacter michiganensis subsp. insidiosus]RMC84910.1 hypothetical protein CmiCFBP2404_09825 [Clavibacter michiganensis subsp. insidiosus]